MKTPKLDELLSKVFPHSWQREVVAGIKAEVAEDIRASCEDAFEEGRNAESHWPNPYARKAGT